MPFFFLCLVHFSSLDLQAAKQKAIVEKQAQIEADIANSGPDKRAIEQEQMVNKLLELNKVIRPVCSFLPPFLCSIPIFLIFVRQVLQSSISNLLCSFLTLNGSAQIRPDGNCMFAAVVDQLSLMERGDEYNTSTLRSKVSDFIFEHSDDYLPFCAEDQGIDLELLPS